jgi:starch synthase
VGGLANTVFDRDYDQTHPTSKRNGYVFHQTDQQALESAMDRAIGLWHSYPQEFRLLMKQGMAYDYSWKNPGTDYLKVYEFIRHK